MTMGVRGGLCLLLLALLLEGGTLGLEAADVVPKVLAEEELILEDLLREE